ncbi:MAG: RNA polymerase sigma factor [Candidatus Pacebacteria bacterium]|nr:RNA polymerase sigma factor [Candidatus Paceibacterota bacterium]
MKQEQAFLEAFDKYADALYRHAYFRVSDKERAQDLVSDAFARTWDYLIKGNVVDDFRPFLYRTLNRLIIDEYRKKKTESLDALLEEKDVPEGAFAELVEGSRAESEMSLDAKQVPILLEAMPTQYKDVIVMRYLDGLMPAEIAEVLDESVNTVSVRIHRGMAWLVKNAEDLRPFSQKK